MADDSSTILQNILNQITVLTGNNGLISKSDKTMDLLKDIKKLLEKGPQNNSGGQKSNNSSNNIQAEKKRMDDRQRAYDDAQAKEINARSKAANDLVLSLGLVSGHVVGLSKTLITSGGSIGKVADHLVSSLGHIPIAGGLMAVALGAIVEVIHDNIKVYKDLASSGVDFGSSMFKVNLAAAKSGLSLNDFADVLKANSTTINQYGVESFGELSKTVREANGYLYTYGLGTKEINEYLGDYLDIQRQAGILDKLSRNDLNKGYGETEKSLHEFSLTTGKSMKELNANLKKSSDSVSFNAAIADKSATEQDKLRQKYAAIQTIAPQLTGAFESAVSGFGGVTNETFQHLLVVAPELAKALEEGANSSETATEYTQRLNKLAKEELAGRKDFIKNIAHTNPELMDAAQALQSLGRDVKEVSAEELARKEKEEGLIKKLVEFEGVWTTVISNIKVGFLNGLAPFLDKFSDPEFMKSFNEFSAGLVNVADFLGKTLGVVLTGLADTISFLTKTIGGTATAALALAAALLLASKTARRGLMGGIKLPGKLGRGVSKLFGKGGVTAVEMALGGGLGELGDIGGAASKGLDLGAKALSGVGAGIGVGSKVAGTALKAAGKLALAGSKAIPFVGEAIMIGQALFDAYDGFQNAGKILQKNEKDLDFGDRMAAATGAAIGGFVGIVDDITGLFGFETHLGDWVTQQSAKALDTIKDLYVGAFKWIAGTLGDMASGATKAVSSAASGVWNYFFGSSTTQPTAPSAAAANTAATTTSTPQVTSTVTSQMSQVTAAAATGAAGATTTSIPAKQNMDDLINTVSSSNSSTSDLLVSLNNKMDSTIMKFNMLIDAVNKQTELLYPVLMEINKSADDSASSLKSSGSFLK